MLLVLCVDLDDDVGRKAGVETPVIGRDAVESAAVALATADPEDSDVNVLFEGIRRYDETADESVEVAVVTGVEGSDVAANTAVGDEVDTVLASLATDEDVSALLVTDGAQDESVVPVVRSRVRIDGVRRVVVRQSQNLESMYYTIKQVLNDPETRGTILVPLGILLLIYPLAILATAMGLPAGSAFGVISGLLGLYVLGRGLGAGDMLDRSVDRLRSSLFTGRASLVTYVVAAVLLVVGGVSGVRTLEATAGDPSVVRILAALVYGSIHWFAAAGVTASLGNLTDEYLEGNFEYRYLNAPFYVVSIALVLHGVSAYLLVPSVRISYLALALTGGTLLGVGSTLAFAVAQTRRERAEPA